MTSPDKIARRKLSLLELASELSNVSGACKLMGYSRQQTRLLERFSPEFRERHIEAPHTGSLVAVDTFFVGTLKGVGKLYLQTAIDCHSRYAWAGLYSSKLPVTAVHLMNNDVILTFEQHKAKIEIVLSDNGREFCGRPDQHPYELYLRLEEVEHRTTRVKRPQTNGIVERLHRTLLDEHFRVEGRRTWFETVEEMQTVLDEYLVGYNQRRPHQGRGMNGRTPAVAFIDGLLKPQQPKEDNKTEKRNTKKAAGCRPLTEALSADYPLCTLMRNLRLPAAACGSS